MKIKLSKSQWEQVGKTAGWLKKEAQDPWEAEAVRRGMSPDDAYDLKRDYHGDLQEATKSQPKQNSTQQEFIKVLDSMVTDKDSETYKNIKERIEQNEYNSKFHLINSIKKRVATPPSPPKQKSKFEPELEAYDRKNYGLGQRGVSFRKKPLPPEIEAEKQDQIKLMIQALVEQAGMSVKENGRLEINPWNEKVKYEPRKIEEVLTNGAREGKWDAYLAKEFIADIKESWEVQTR